MNDRYVVASLTVAFGRPSSPVTFRLLGLCAVPWHLDLLQIRSGIRRPSQAPVIASPDTFPTLESDTMSRLVEVSRAR
jgi:hypothetical protein